MPKITIIFSLVLILMGLVSYLATMTHWTAMIPAIIGVPFLALGLVALKENLRKHAMHATSVLALLVVLMSAGRFVPAALGGGEMSLALIMTGLMGVLAAVYLALCVRSFIEARKRQRAAA